MFSNSCAETWRPSRTGGVYLFCLTHHDERLSRGLVWSSSPYCWPFIRLQRSAPSARGDESSPALRTNHLLSWFRVCAASSVLRPDEVDVCDVDFRHKFTCSDRRVSVQSKFTSCFQNSLLDLNFLSKPVSNKRFLKLRKIMVDFRRREIWLML